VGVTAKECWGDGFCVSGASQVTLCGVTADHNRRQGLSITGVDSMVVRNSLFARTGGTLPEAGIDIETQHGIVEYLSSGNTVSGNGLVP
jgi:hypothetical protein